MTISSLKKAVSPKTHKTATDPYSPSDPVPNVQKYRQGKDGEVDDHDGEEKEEDGEGVIRGTSRAMKKSAGLDSSKDVSGTLYRATNRNAKTEINEFTLPERKSDDDSKTSTQHPENCEPPSQSEPQQAEVTQNSTQTSADPLDLRAKRKTMKKRDSNHKEVTDPVTHLPVLIKDAQTADINKAPKNEPSSTSDPGKRTGPTGAAKSDSQLEKEAEEQRALSQNMHRLFPPPDYDEIHDELSKYSQRATAVGVLLGIGCWILLFAGIKSIPISDLWNTQNSSVEWQRVLIPVLALLFVSCLVGGLAIWTVTAWLSKKTREIWDERIWTAAGTQEKREIKDQYLVPESAQWLNEFLASVWPIINPDLFTSIADILEDVMQASLPKFVRMISVDDLGQGSEALRILGVRWLPTGAASGHVDSDGKVKAQSRGNISKSSSGQEELEIDENDRAEDDSGDGMEAEEGDFVNLEIAFAYRARSTGKSIRTKSENAHIFIKFYMPGSIAAPVWVEVRGFVGTMRVRLQLTPDPPFVALATMTFLGQPKADLSCLPLSKHSLNILDVPLISSFVQSCIDAALAEYVAPRSLSVDLKAMLLGDDFKKDTSAIGVVVVHVNKASGIMQGDSSLGPLKDGSSDAYITVGWGKFGKPVTSTRIIFEEQNPVWDEYTYAVVSDQELNAQEMVRVQLWDSDRTTADDDLGRVEVGLHELMKDSQSNGRMREREDGFGGPDGRKTMPGVLYWSIGYFPKAHINEEQIEAQTEAPDIKGIADLKRKARESAQQKLRESSKQNGSDHLKQQEKQEYKDREDSLVIASPPPTEFPSGIISIQIHQITGLQLQSLRKKRNNQKILSEADAEDEDSDDLPSAYCTIILNHSMVYKTRTKPKNAKPFFNAGCERFIRDWRTSELIVSVRDARVHENDPLLGVIYLPLDNLLAKRSQMVDVFPLVGGIGYGRARVSIVFRAVTLQLPKELRGWDYGTLEISNVEAGKYLIDDIRKLKVKFSTSIATSRMRPTSDGKGDERGGMYRPEENQGWTKKHQSAEDPTYLAVKSRYSTPLMIEFYQPALVSGEKMPGFAVFWLKDIPDDEEQTIRLPVWTGSKEAIKRGRGCVGYDGLEEHEAPLGTIKLTIKFWRGLSGYHTRLAGKSREVKLRNVMEALDSANDNKEGKGKGTAGADTAGEEPDPQLQEAGMPDTSSSSSSSSDYSGEEIEHASGKNKMQKDGRVKSHLKSKLNPISKDKQASFRRPDGGITSNHPDVDSEDEEQSKMQNQQSNRQDPVDQVQDYRRHRKSMHRRHRGLMQWKGARTLEWMADRADRGKDKIVTGVVGRRGAAGIGEDGGEVQTEA